MSAHSSPNTPASPPTPRPTLYLIDGYAQFFRAYHAIRTPMSSPVTKEPTNMSFGFLGMLLKLLRGRTSQSTILDARPTYLAVTLDVSGDRGTFRSQLYPDYKANRPPPPEDLRPQVERCISTLTAMGIPILGAEGFEADDVIATLVSQLRTSHPDLRIRIISKDKDLKQLLVEERVELVDIHNDEVISQSALKADSGLEPSQIIDYLALMGDNVDNVPGVDGVGPKTAAQLITQFGSLEAVVAEAQKAVSAIKGKRQENILAAAPQLPLSRQLVTLRTDVPITLDLAAADPCRFRLAELLPVLKLLGFNRYQDDLRALLPEYDQSTSDSASDTGPAAPRVSVLSPAPSKPAPARKSPAPSGDLFSPGLFDQSDGPSPASIRNVQGDYRCITTEKELADLVDELRAAPIIAIDTETTGLVPLRSRLAGLCFSAKIGTGVYVPVRSPSPKDHLTESMVLSALRPIIEDPTKPKCGHNLKFDHLVLRRAGLHLAGFLATPQSAQPQSWSFASALPFVSTVFDSMVASYLIDAERSSHSLDALALALLNRTNISIKELIGTGKNQRRFDQVPLDQAAPYAAEDADVALQLRSIMLPQLVAMGLEPLFTQIEMPLVEVLAELEFNGIRVDKAELDRQRLRLQARIDTLRREIVDFAEDTLGRPFNPDSPKQLAAVLFNKPNDPAEPGFGLKPIKRIQTGYSTDAEVLEKLAEDPTIDNPIPQKIVEHRELTKLVSTYLAALVDDIYPENDPAILGGGRIHASFHQTVAATGRLSSSDPNLQNIPIRTDVGREIRKAFVAEPGHVLISADYSQIELRLLAHLSKDAALIQAFIDGQDIHTAVAAQIHAIPLSSVSRDQRSGAKMVNFGIVYGITPFGLARRLGISNTQADEIIRGYKKRFAGITTFLQECIDQAVRFGYVQTITGRRRPIGDIQSRNPSRRSFAERTAINSVVQGSAADLIKLAMVDLQGAIAGKPGRAALRPPPGLKMLLQIHDELVFECPVESASDAQVFVSTIMENAMHLTVPLKVDAGTSTNWFDGH